MEFLFCSLRVVIRWTFYVIRTWMGFKRGQNVQRLTSNVLPISDFLTNISAIRPFFSTLLNLILSKALLALKTNYKQQA